MILDKLGSSLVYFGRGHLTGLQSEGRHLLIVVCSLDLRLFQMGGVAFNLNGGTRNSKDGQFGEVGEHEDEGQRIFQWDTVFELAFLQTDGVQLVTSVRTIYI